MQPISLAYNTQMEITTNSFPWSGIAKELNITEHISSVEQMLHAGGKRPLVLKNAKYFCALSILNIPPKDLNMHAFWTRSPYGDNHFPIFNRDAVIDVYSQYFLHNGTKTIGMTTQAELLLYYAQSPLPYIESRTQFINELTSGELSREGAVVIGTPKFIQLNGVPSRTRLGGGVYMGDNLKALYSCANQFEYLVTQEALTHLNT